MKRKDFLSYLKKINCVLYREGGKHSVYFNPLTRKFSTVPRHREIPDLLVKKICKDLNILPPRM